MNSLSGATYWSAALLLIGSSVLFAQPRRGMGMMSRYDKSTEAKFSGTVEDVAQAQGRRGNMGSHLALKTDSGTHDVHLGPAAYISKEGFSFAKGDQIEVLGSKITLAGKDAIIAREVTKDGKTLVLRDENGRPQWSRSAMPQ